MSATLRTTAGLGALAVANIVAAFAYPWYAVVRFGAGAQTDTLFGSLTVPVLTLSVIAESLTNVLVPILAGLDGRRFERVGWTVAQVVAAGFVLLSLLLALGAPAWIGWLMPGFDADARALAATMTRIVLAGVAFGAVNAVIAAALYARHRFYRAEAGQLAAHAIALALLPWLAARFGVTGVAVALALRPAVQCALLVGTLGRYALPDWRDDAVRECGRRMRPLLAGSAYYKTDLLVDRFLASHAPAGGLTLLHLGQQLWGAGNTVLTRAITAPMVPGLTALADTGRWHDFARRVRRRALAVLVVTLVAVVAVAALGEPLLAWVFALRPGAGERPGQGAELAWLMVALAGVLVGGALGQILASSFYASHDVRTPTVIGIAGFTVGVFAKIAGFHWAGIPGLAAATSLYYMLNALLLAWALRRRLAAARGGA